VNWEEFVSERKAGIGLFPFSLKASKAAKRVVAKSHPRSHSVRYRARRGEEKPSQANFRLPEEEEERK